MCALNSGIGQKDELKKWSVLKISLIGAASFLLVATGVIVWFLYSLFAEPDLSKLPAYHPFKSLKAQEQYLHYYDSRAKEWPVASEVKLVETSFGKTFVRISGQPNSPVLVLMPSVGAPSLMWLPNIKGLSEHFRVYAVDNVYDVGRSINYRVMKNSRDMVVWMDELFSGLALGDSINIAGLSLGGWLTSEYTLAHPERLRKAIWIAPIATIIDIPSDWAWRGVIGAIPIRCCTYSMLNWAFSDLVKKQDEYSKKLVADIITDALMGFKCFKFRMPVTPLVLADKELASIRVPVLFLVGEHEVIYPAKEAIHRLNRVAPQVKTEVVPNASHDITFVQAELVNKSIINFVKN
jgi:pimeloyl-ACP methyl ester carboxylesterase